MKRSYLSFSLFILFLCCGINLQAFDQTTSIAFAESGNLDKAKMLWKEGRGHYKAERFKEALMSYSQAYSMSLRDPDFLNDYGNVNLILENYSDAITYYTQALEKKKKPKYYYNRGLAFYRNKAYDQGMSDLSEAIQLDEKDASSYALRGKIYFHLDTPDYIAARKDLDIAILLNPDQKDAYFYRGLLYTKESKLEKAKEQYRQACDKGYEEGCEKIGGANKPPEATPGPTATPFPQFTPPPQSNEPIFNRVRYINSPDVNIRYAPGTNAESLFLAPKDERLEVSEKISEKDGLTWIFVRLKDGRTGWVATKFLAVEQASGQNTGVVRYINDSGVNIRSGPSKRTQVLLQLDTNDSVTVTGSGKQSDGYTWVPVRLSDGRNGWVAVNYLATQLIQRTELVRYINDDSVNIRSGPSTGSQVLIQLDTNNTVTVTGSGKQSDGYTWVPVRLSDGRNGWIAINYLATQLIHRTELVRYINNNGVNIRFGPSKGSQVLSQMDINSTVIVMGIGKQSDGFTWVPVKIPDQRTGWVVVNFLTTKPVDITSTTTTATTSENTTGILMCRDGTPSPTCACPGHRGCCSHHGGIGECKH